MEIELQAEEAGLARLMEERQRLLDVVARATEVPHLEAESEHEISSRLDVNERKLSQLEQKLDRVATNATHLAEFL